jgi:hypothetical protein
MEQFLYPDLLRRGSAAAYCYRDNAGRRGEQVPGSAEPPVSAGGSYIKDLSCVYAAAGNVGHFAYNLLR